MNNKELLRRWAKNIRKTLDISKISAELTEKLLQTEEYKNAKNIMIFYPLKDEINLLSLLEDNSKRFYLPRINNQELECCPYSKGDKLNESGFHTQEPVCASCSKTDIDLVIVPALACDKTGCRIGYGGGYYDRFLSDFDGIKLACIPKELYVDTVYPEPLDVKMDLVLHS